MNDRGPSDAARVSPSGASAGASPAALAGSRPWATEPNNGRGITNPGIVVQPAAFSPGVVHMRLSDDSVVPSLDELRRWLDRLGADPAVTTVRTSALFPRAAQRFEQAGFAVADTLSLLRADLTSRSVRAALHGRRPRDAANTGMLRRRHHGAASEVDRAAFGAEWGHDAAELAQIRKATPRHRARCRYERIGAFGRDIQAFALSGASSDHGYLQRLSVDPAHQRRGHGRVLTLDALRWMTRRGLPDCLVNTSIENAPALALYESTGFEPLRDRLSVLHCDVRSR